MEIGAIGYATVARIGQGWRNVACNAARKRNSESDLFQPKVTYLLPPRTTHVADVTETSPAPGLQVYVWKRQLDFKSQRASALLTAPAKAFAQEHVGIKIISACSSDPIYLEFVAKVGQGTRDFVAFVSSSAVINKNHDIAQHMGTEYEACLAGIGDTCLAGVSSKTLDDIDRFNSEYPLTYMLGIRDCRDYAADLVGYLTDTQILPGQLTTWINHNMPVASACD
jgi:hypothetical protein